MGGVPKFCLVSLCVPEWAQARWVDRFFDGILQLAAAAGATLAGGDLSHGNRLFCDVTVCGSVPRGAALRRDGARAGHEIYVSGTLGGSALGLETMRGKARQRHLLPEPRIALGSFVREKLRATAAIDISDGLSLDLRRLCLASGVGADIVPPPVFRGASLDQALHGGEEYELLFTVRGGTRVPPDFEGLPLTRIGRIIPGEGDVRLDGRVLKPLGYDHFDRRGQ
jgi:thiamine-monophosphate kinase